jgi:uncharacterized OB-fold protein
MSPTGTKCPKCGHDSTNPFEAYCTEVVVDKNVKVRQSDGSTVIEPEMPSFCACKNLWHKSK